jgi:flagellar assembly protein FliH
MELSPNTLEPRAEEGPVNQPVKFLFDVEFDRNGSRSRAAEHEAAVTAADAEGYRRGFTAAKAEAIAETERRLAAALGHAADGLGDIFRKLSVLETRLEHEAVEVALSVARKLAPALIAREPLAEIEALVTDVFAHERSAPHVVVRLAEDLLETANARLKEISEQRGFAGRLVLLPAPELAPDECRIEWADGGVVRERAAIENRIAEAVARYLGRGGAPAPASDPETDR